jgi:SAM-dependent methyltransferase
MDPTRFYNEMKRLTFPRGYWLCLPSGHDFSEFNALVFLPYLGSGKIAILLGDEELPWTEVEPQGSFLDVCSRLELPGSRPIALRFEVGQTKEQPSIIRCRDRLSAAQIGCEYYVSASSYFVEIAGSAMHMLRSARTTDQAYFKFLGYDDARKLLKIFRTGRLRTQKLRILDWGVGAGRISMHLRKHTELEVFGADIDPITMEQLHASGFERSKFKLMKAGGDIPFPDNSFDACFGYSVFTHLTGDLETRYLSEVRRVLKPGGVAVFSVHGLSHFFLRINDGSVFFEWIKNGLYVLDRNKDISEGFLGADERSIYVNTLHSPGYILERWGEFFSDIRIIEAPNASGHDLVVCRG